MVKKYFVKIIFNFKETIDDDMQDRSSVKMVKIDDDDEADEYGLTERPALVFFEHQVPNVFEGDLTDHDQGRKSEILLGLDNRGKVTSWCLLAFSSKNKQSKHIPDSVRVFGFRYINRMPLFLLKLLHNF
jgi:hypothetical protein